MKQKISFNTLEATIDLKGAYVDEFKYNGKDIFYPRTTLEIDGIVKERGGSHICLPLFGPNDIYGFNRHGFGRESTWDLETKADNYIKLRLSPNYKEFETMISTLEYTLLNNEFKTELIVMNIGEEDIVISPAFHPYFNMKDNGNIVINGENLPYNEDELNGTIFFEEVKELNTDEYNIFFSQENLSKYAIWTDRLEEYLCLEPTFNHTHKDYFTLKPGDKESFQFTLRIENK